MIAYTAALGFRAIESSHAPSNNAALIPKLRAGFMIVSLGIDMREGPAVKLRYFHDREREEAEAIGQALRKGGAEDLVVKKVPGYENSTAIRPRHYELWLRPRG